MSYVFACISTIIFQVIYKIMGLDSLEPAIMFFMFVVLYEIQDMKSKN